MKKLYNEFFFVPKCGNGKIKDKVLLSRIGISIGLIVLCMAAISLTAFAYFSHSLTVKLPVIKSAYWEIKVTAEPDVTVNEGVYVLDNSSGTDQRIFQIVVKKNEATATATVGYVKIDIRTDVDGYVGDQTFYTLPIGDFLVGGVMSTDSDREIMICVPAGKIAHVKFTGEWGSCAKEPIIEQLIEPDFAAVADVEEETQPAPENDYQSQSTQTQQTDTETQQTNTETQTIEKNEEIISDETESLPTSTEEIDSTSVESYN